MIPWVTSKSKPTDLSGKLIGHFSQNPEPLILFARGLKGLLVVTEAIALCNATSEKDFQMSPLPLLPGRFWQQSTWRITVSYST